MTENIAIHWFRQDLRLSDNPALFNAVKTGAQIIPVYVLDDENAQDWKMGGASRAWVHHSLQALNESLDGNLWVAKGDALKIIPTIAKDTGASTVFWNRCYEPWRIARDKSIKQTLKENNVECESFNGSLLWEPWDVLKDDGTPYKVFTPFFRKGCLGKAAAPRTPLPKPENISFAAHHTKTSIHDLGLLPQKPEPRWDVDMVKDWMIGETGAQESLYLFLDDGLNN